MAPGQTVERDQELDREIERYREAATATLGQLEWTIDYLNRIHKRQIAGALENNRRQIMKRIAVG